MAWIRKPTQYRVEEVKDHYKKWKSGISIVPDRLDWAGEDYLMSQARLFLIMSDLCWNYSDDVMAKGITEAAIHTQALNQLKEEGWLSELKEENQQKIIELLEHAEEGLSKVDWEWLSKTKVNLKLWSFESEVRPRKKMEVIPKKFTDKHLKIQEQVWGMLRTKKLKPTIEKIDRCLYKVWENWILSMYHEGEDSVKKKRYEKRLRQELFKVVEIQKMICWFLKSERGQKCYPNLRWSFEGRLKIVDQIISEFVK